MAFIAVRAFRWLAALAMLGWAASPGIAFELRSGLDRQDLSAFVELLEDPTGKLQISDITSPEKASQFKAWDAAKGSPSVGFTNSAIWVRFKLSRTPEATDRWLLEVPYAYNKFLDFYAPAEPAVFTGSGRAVSTRPLFDRFFVFPVTVATEPEYFYFRVASNYAVSLPMRIWDRSAYSRNALQSNLLNALYYGGLLALALYNFFLFFSLSDKRFLFYALFALSLNAGIFAGNGLLALFVWPTWIAFHEIASQLLISLSGFAGIRFCRLFLQVQNHSQRIGIAMQAIEWAFVGIAALLMVSALWGFSPQSLFLALASTGAISAVLIIVASVQAIRHGVAGIRFFVMAWSILLAGTLIAAMRQFDLLPTNAFTSYALQIASGFEMLLLALALAEIVQSERRARIQAQAQALEANEKMIQGLRAAEQRLETAVEDRTRKLQESVLRERHLLGQYLRFGALISHEFRNPLGIIDSQATLIQKSKDANNDIRQRISVIRKTVRRLASLFELWLQGDRIRLAIDKLQIQEVPMARWARTLLTKVPHCTETHAVELQIGPPCDRIWADVSLLEIAVVNLIENACKYAAAGTTITLKSVQVGERCGITVIDRGPGIAPEHLARLGEDYYRADPSGPKGIGLGLSLVKEIAEVHGGTLHIESELGVGSRFTLLLPNGDHD